MIYKNDDNNYPIAIAPHLSNNYGNNNTTIQVTPGYASSIKVNPSTGHLTGTSATFSGEIETSSTIKQNGVPINLLGHGENLLYNVPSHLDHNVYDAYRIPLTENLQQGETYTLQLWDVCFNYSGSKTKKIIIYHGGAASGVAKEIYSFPLSRFSQNSDGDYIANYLTHTFTVD
jgi:hypothetical protein